jgi:hypothetical protein
MNIKKLLICLLLGAHGKLHTATPRLLTKELLGYVEPHEYKKSPQTRLIQIPVLNHTKESSEIGSSSLSSPYHALRNTIILVQALKDGAQQAEHLTRLYRKDDLEKMLSYEGNWRSFIRTHRGGGNFTDALTIKELEALIGEEQKKGMLDTCAYFEYASKEEPNNRDFDTYCVTEPLKKIKEKLTTGEDFIAGIIVYSDIHSPQEDIFDDGNFECRICYVRKTSHKTSCCNQVVFCPSCWQTSLSRVSKLCPLCREKNPGPLVDIKILSKEKPLQGHFIGLVVAQVSNQRQYFLADSLNMIGRFSTNKPLKKLLHYLESSSDSIELLPGYVPLPPQIGTPTAQLQEAYATYKNSYLKVARKPTEIKESTSQSKSLLGGGLLAACLIYVFQQYIHVGQPAASSHADSRTTK